MAGVMRPATCYAKNKKQAMYTNLNEVLRANPETFCPKKQAAINFSGTDYNFINFQGLNNEARSSNLMVRRSIGPQNMTNKLNEKVANRTSMS